MPYQFVGKGQMMSWFAFISKVITMLFAVLMGQASG